MMVRFEELPDVEAAVGTWFIAQGLRSYSSIPNNPTWPLLVVMRLGGQPAVPQALDAARIQVEVWGDSSTKKADVFDYARRAARWLNELEDQSVELSNGEVVQVTASRPELGPQWLPDPPTGRPRYIFANRVYARKTSPVTS